MPGIEKMKLPFEEELDRIQEITDPKERQRNINKVFDTATSSKDVRFISPEEYIIEIFPDGRSIFRGFEPGVPHDLTLVSAEETKKFIDSEINKAKEIIRQRESLINSYTQVLPRY